MTTRDAAPAASPLVTIADAAERLSVSPKTIRRYVASGALTAVRIGPRLVRVELASLERLGRPIGNRR